jgi:hypothetical protein
MDANVINTSAILVLAGKMALEWQSSALWNDQRYISVLINAQFMPVLQALRGGLGKLVQFHAHPPRSG